MDKKKMLYTTIQVPVSLHRQLRILAIAENLTMAELLQQLLVTQLDSHPHLQRVLSTVEAEMAHV